jgi:hypothetical protein
VRAVRVCGRCGILRYAQDDGKNKQQQKQILFGDDNKRSNGTKEVTADEEAPTVPSSLAALRMTAKADNDKGKQA